MRLYLKNIYIFSISITLLCFVLFFYRLMVRRPPKARRSQQDALRGCLLNQLLLNQNQRPKKPPRPRRQPRGRRAATLLKMVTPRQTRHRRLTLLVMPNEKLMSV